MTNTDNTYAAAFLARNLKLLRTARHISQDKLTAALCIPRAAYSGFEKGTKVPDLLCINALASFYEIPAECLVKQDLSAGLMNRIYLQSENRAMAELISKYEGLSVISKLIVSERIAVLLENESAAGLNSENDVIELVRELRSEDENT